MNNNLSIRIHTHSYSNMPHHYETRLQTSNSKEVPPKKRKKCSKAVVKERKKHRRNRVTSIEIQKNDAKTFGYTPRRPRTKKSTLSLLPTRKQSNEAIQSFLKKKSKVFKKAVSNWDIGDTTEVKAWYGRHISPHLKWMKVMAPTHKNPSVDTQQFKQEAWQSFLFGVPYVHVGNSEGRGKGVFASRTFGKDDIIGLYLGFKETRRNTEYRFKNIDLDRDGLQSHLFMGIHFLNDPYFKGTNETSPQTKSDTEHPNVLVDTNYMCKALRRIEKDEELLFVYKWGKSSNK